MNPMSSLHSTCTQLSDVDHYSHSLEVCDVDSFSMNTKRLVSVHVFHLTLSLLRVFLLFFHQNSILPFWFGKCLYRYESRYDSQTISTFVEFFGTRTSLCRFWKIRYGLFLSNIGSSISPSNFSRIWVRYERNLSTCRARKYKISWIWTSWRMLILCLCSCMTVVYLWKSDSGLEIRRSFFRSCRHFWIWVFETLTMWLEHLKSYNHGRSDPTFVKFLGIISSFLLRYM